MGSPQGRKGGVSGLRLFVGAVVLMVIATVGVGLYLAGSPGKERARRFDEQRVNELQQIATAVDSAYYRDGRLPTSLEQLSSAPEYGYLPSLVDPETSAPYEYRPTNGDTYELCATFVGESQQTDQYGRMKPVPPRPMMDSAMMPYPGYRDWTHGAGRHCFQLTVEPRVPNQVCGLTNPCDAGQTCATLPDNKGTVCVPAGKECLAAGCPDEQCVIAESYPVQVRCTSAEKQPPSAATCDLLREKKSGKVDCFGCGTRVCKDPAPGWEPYSAPEVGIPYACYIDDKGACALAQ